MTELSILVCDDDGRNTKQWAGAIERMARDLHRTLSPQAITLETFKSSIEGLEKRRQLARERKPDASQSIFDDADVLLIDYDLVEFDSNTYFTGENVAYLVRCYSRCKVIVGVNQFGENPFDLTLKGHPESYADLNIGARQIANPGLWFEPFTSFRPWVWPLVPQAVEAFVARVGELEAAFNTPILDHLGFGPEHVEILTRGALEFLESKRDRSEQTTFEDFVRKSGRGLRPKDELYEAPAGPRIAAARLAKWLERHVIAGQNILADAPHLVARFPSLLSGNRKKVEAWNATTSLTGAGKAGIRYDAIRSDAFARPHWSSRPVWWMNEVARNTGVGEVSDPWSAAPAEFVFCEDVSAHLPLSATREFVANLDSPNVRRYCVDPSATGATRFAEAIEQVDYLPRVRFAQ